MYLAIRFSAPRSLVEKSQSLTLTTKPTSGSLASFNKRIFVGAGFKGLYVVEDGAVIPFKNNIRSYNLI